MSGRLQRQDKVLFKINYAFDKDQTTRVIYMTVKTFLIELTFPEFHFETEAKVDFPSVYI